MAITAIHLTTAASDTDADSRTTASISPTANRLVLAAVLNADTTTPATPTLAGNSLTWVQIATILFDTIALPLKRLTLFRAMGASPTAGSVTITAASSTGWGWSIAEFADVDTSGTNGSGAIVQSATNNANSAIGLTVTLAAFADGVNNAAYGTFGLDELSSIQQEDGSTELGQANGVSPTTAINSQWRLGDTDPEASFGSSNCAGIAVEIKAAPAAAGQPMMRRWGGVPHLTPGPVKRGRLWCVEHKLKVASRNLLLTR